MNLAFHDALQRLLDQRISELQTELGNGNAADFPEYMRRVGHIEGVRDALTQAFLIRKRLIEG